MIFFCFCFEFDDDGDEFFSQVTGGDSEGSDKARIEGSAEAAFARRRCSCSGFHRDFWADRLSGTLISCKIGDFLEF